MRGVDAHAPSAGAGPAHSQDLHHEIARPVALKKGVRYRGTCQPRQVPSGIGAKAHRTEMPTRFENFRRSPRCLTPGASWFLEACRPHPLFRCRGRSPFPPGYLCEVTNALEKGRSGGAAYVHMARGNSSPSGSSRLRPSSTTRSGRPTWRARASATYRAADFTPASRCIR